MISESEITKNIISGKQTRVIIDNDTDNETIEDVLRWIDRNRKSYGVVTVCDMSNFSNRSWSLEFGDPEFLCIHVNGRGIPFRYIQKFLKIVRKPNFEHVFV